VPQVSVSKLLNSLESAAARRANLILHRTGQPFWQDESYDHSVRDPDEFSASDITSRTIPLPRGWPERESDTVGPAGRRVTPPQPAGLPHKLRVISADWFQ
jgi:hypothetical protein